MRSCRRWYCCLPILLPLVLLPAAGLRHARWNVSSKVPLLAMVLPKAVEEKVCPPWLEKTGAAVVLRGASALAAGIA